MALFGVARPFLDGSIASIIGPGLAAGGTLMGVTGASIALDAVAIDRGASYRRT